MSKKDLELTYTWVWVEVVENLANVAVVRSLAAAPLFERQFRSNKPFQICKCLYYPADTNLFGQSFWKLVLGHYFYTCKHSSIDRRYEFSHFSNQQLLTVTIVVLALILKGGITKKRRIWSSFHIIEYFLRILLYKYFKKQYLFKVFLTEISSLSHIQIIMAPLLFSATEPKSASAQCQNCCEYSKDQSKDPLSCSTAGYQIGLIGDMCHGVTHAKIETVPVNSWQGSIL